MRHEATLPWILLGLAVSVQCGGVEADMEADMETDIRDRIVETDMETDMETDIRDRIVHHLGLSSRPDVLHVSRNQRSNAEVDF